MALVGDIGAERVINFINDNRTSGIGKNLFMAYCQRLVKLKDVEGLRLLFKQELEENDLYDLVTESVRLACEENFDLTKWFESPDSLQIPLLICYRVLQSNPPSSNLTISAPDTGILELKDYELSNNRIELALFFHKIFFSTLAFSLCSDPDRARSLLTGLSQRTWVERFCFHLVDLAIECARRFKANEKYNYSWLYQAIEKFPPTNSDDDRDLRGFYTYATQAVIEIALDIRHTENLAIFLY